MVPKTGVWPGTRRLPLVASRHACAATDAQSDTQLTHVEYIQSALFFVNDIPHFDIHAMVNTHTHTNAHTDEYTHTDSCLKTQLIQFHVQIS